MNSTADPPLLIPYQMLDAETLENLLEDFVTRDGTDNGDETPLHQRVARAKQALQKKQAFILFNSDLGQCQLVAKHEIPPQYLAEWPDDDD